MSKTSITTYGQLGLGDLFLQILARELLANRHLHQLPYSQFNPQVLILRSWHEEILEQLQNHVTQNCPLPRTRLSTKFVTLCKGGALFPQDSVNLFCHDAHFAQMAK
jgi:hypothetical protein